MKNRENALINVMSSAREKDQFTGKKALSRRNKYIHKVRIHVPPQKRHADCLKYICWIIVPIIIFIFVLLDAFAIYSFNKERLIVLGIGLLIILLPFIHEIKLKNFSFKRNDKDNTNL